MKIPKLLNFIGVLLIAWSMVRCVPSQGNMFDGKIVFRSNRDGNYDLYVMNPDGSSQRKLASFPGRTSSPNDNNGLIPSPDGRQFAFLSDEDGNFEIYVIDIDTGVRSNLTRNKANEISFAWSPNGKYIAFVSDRDSVLMNADRDLWTNNLYVMDSDGANIHRLTINNKTNQYGGLSWSPDGNKLVLSISSLSPYGPFISGIYIMNISDSSVTRLTSPSDLVQDDPTWSPDGKHIMYHVSGSMLDNIYTMNADGTDKVVLSKKVLGFVISASWSPNGEYIVFSSKQDGKYYLYTVKADGTDLVALSKGSSNYDTSPSWSPNGKYIVFSSKQDGGKYHLYIMNTNGTNQRRLTNGPGEEASPVWLPMP